jgi:hypothetical protein
MLSTDAVLPLVLFVALVLALSLHGLAASGQFPREHRAAALRSPPGAMILFGSIAVALICLVAGVGGAWRLLPWYAIVIGAGAAFLAAPMVLRTLPDSVVDGRGALIAFAGAGVVLAGAMIWLV